MTAPPTVPARDVATALVGCPECGTEVPVSISLAAPVTADGWLYVPVEPDMTDLWAHVWTHHEQEGRSA